MSYQLGMGIPMFIVTGWVGAVGRTNFKCGICFDSICATSANPSAVSPSPWLMTTRPDWSDSFFGETVMVVPVRVMVDILDAWKDMAWDE